MCTPGRLFFALGEAIPRPTRTAQSLTTHFVDLAGLNKALNVPRESGFDPAENWQSRASKKHHMRDRSIYGTHYDRLFPSDKEAVV